MTNSAPAPDTLIEELREHACSVRDHAIREDLAEALEQAATALAAREKETRVLRDALAEIVACWDLQDRIAEFHHTDECLAAGWEKCPQTLMENEYERRWPLAVEAARAALCDCDTILCYFCGQVDCRCE